MTLSSRSLERWVEQFDTDDLDIAAEIERVRGERPIAEAVVSGGLPSSTIASKIEKHHGLTYADYLGDGEGVGCGWYAPPSALPFVSYGIVTPDELDVLGDVGATIHSPRGKQWGTRSYRVLFCELPDTLAADPHLVEAERQAGTPADADD